MGNYKNEEKERLSLRVSPVTSFRLEKQKKMKGFRSKNELAEAALIFYLDYLEAENAGLFLPTAIKSYLDGRLGQLEDKLSALLFRQSVEVDMLAGVLADSFQFDQEDLLRRRKNSVQNVKKTNGRISFEQRVRETWEEDEADEWQD